MLEAAKEQHEEEGTTDIVTQFKFVFNDISGTVAYRTADMIASIIASSGWFSRQLVRCVGERKYEVRYAIFNNPTYELISISATVLGIECESVSDSDSNSEDPTPAVPQAHDLD